MKYIVYSERKIKLFGKKRKKFNTLKKANNYIEKLIEKNNKVIGLKDMD